MTVTKKQIFGEEEERAVILAGLHHTRDEIRAARADFNMAIEPELVEACVYRINAMQSQHAYYLRLAKEKNMALSYGDMCKEQ